MTKQLLVLIATFLLQVGGFALAQDACSPTDELLKSLSPEPTKKCLKSIWSSLNNNKKTDIEFTERFISALLPLTFDESDRTSKLEQFDVDYTRIAEIIAYLDSDKLTQRYLDFIVTTAGSADELRSFGLGTLYTLRAPHFLKLLSKYIDKDQKTIIASLSWGLANNFYPQLTNKNYRSLIVGKHRDLLDAKHPDRKLATEIEREVLRIITESNKIR